MANKDENQNSRQLFSEDITKRLVKKILDENTSEDDEYPEYQEDYQRYSENNEKNNNFNIEYEEYDSSNFYKEEKQPKKSKKVKQPQAKHNQPKNNDYYRKNIDKYGKDFFDDDDFDDEDDEYSPSIIGRVISIGVILVLTISTAFLAINLKLTKNELNSKISELENLQAITENPETKITEESLKAELDSLRKENEALKEKLDPNYKQNNKTNQKPNTNSSNNTPTTSNNSSSTEYIVKEGDIIWNISKKVYGNGAYYQKILDANNLKENSILKPGQKLIIPKLN